jgi:hypothetical protein
MLRKSPPVKQASQEKRDLKLIKCSHILHDRADIWSGIDLGDNRVAALCKRCEEGIVARTLSSLWKEALKEYMEKHLPPMPVAPAVTEEEHAEGIYAQPNAERDTTIQS